MLHRLPFRAMGCQMLALLDQETEAERGIASTLRPQPGRRGRVKRAQEPAPVAVRATRPGSTPAVRPAGAAIRNSREILAQVPDWFEEWEQVLSRFRSDSELSRLNRSPDQPVPVSQTLWDVFQASLAADKATGGLVTPTVLDAIVQAGYDRPFEELLSCRDFVDLLAEIQPLSLVVTDEEGHTICLPPNIHLDFGGIAKGWAAHQTVQRLKSYGPTLMNAGGDIAVSGPRLDGNPWRIGISNPFEPAEDLAIMNLSGGGVATSGKDRRRWRQGAFLNHHIIDPRTGKSAMTDILTATVIAPTALEAETAAKTVFLLGSRFGLEWLESEPDLAALAVLDDGEVLISSQMEKYL